MAITKSYLHKQLLIILLVIIGLAVSVRLVFPPFYNIGKLQSVKQFTDEKLFDEFVSDQIDAQSRYGMKPILVEGKITGVDRGMIIMGEGMELVRIKLMKNWRYQIPKYKYGDQIVIKGICRGIDLTEVLVSNAIIITVRQQK